MQAIILAAGMGKRLGHLTKENTKCMVKVNGTTLIERMLEQLSSLGLAKIVLVIGYKGNELKRMIGVEFNGTPIKYVENPIYYKTNNIYSLYLAKEYLMDDDTILMESDIIFERSILDKLLFDTYPNLAIVSKYQNSMEGTVVLLNNKNYITSFVHKNEFNFKDTNIYYKTVNIYKFSINFSQSHYVPFLEAYSRALGNNEYYEQVLRIITLLDKPSIKAIKLNTERWYEIDDIHDLKTAETLFAKDGDKLKKYQDHFGGFWRYHNIIDFCYLSNPFFPPGMLIEEIKANFNQLLRGYPSGQKMNCLLAANYLSIKKQYVIVGNGSSEIINAYCKTNTLKTGVILPTFEEYRNCLNRSDIVYYTPSNTNFSYTADNLIDWLSNSDIKQLIIINPDNPSGNYIIKNDLILLLNWSKFNNIRLILDESFVDFTDDGCKNSFFDNNILEKYPNLIVIKSISKSYGVPGLRLGVMACSDPEIVKKVKQKLPIWNINSFAEFYLQILAKYDNDYHRALARFRIERDTFFKKLKIVPSLYVIPSQANYFLCKIKVNNPLYIINTLIDKYNIFIKDCTNKRGFNGKPYIRIAVKSKEDNDKIIRALRDMK